MIATVPNSRPRPLSNENHERYRFTWDVLYRLQAQQDLDDSGRIYPHNPIVADG
ncbi:hypothetical protein [Pseudomonas ovata]|uniref:hypothetical protein n=1 Tax=Pseudomonas ovata TaxID=1839709 RepID=UPI00129B1A61|nr:hypothetical protein [Pseudomonas ovata]